MDMQHAYYYYNKEELLKAPKIPLVVMADNSTVFRAMAEEMLEEIKRKNVQGEKTVLICPVGPVGQYPFFTEMVNEQNVSLKNVWFINMDEYLTDDRKWIPKEHSLSFRGFMDRQVYRNIRPELVMPEEQRIFPDPENPGRIQELIDRLGGISALAESASMDMWHLTKPGMTSVRRNFAAFPQGYWKSPGKPGWQMPSVI